jgi:hypothetical protein
MLKKNLYSIMVITISYNYIVKQKIHGGTYAYEAENFWDPAKKQSRQKRRYLGVWDEATCQIIPKIAERDVKTTNTSQLELIFCYPLQ